MRVRQSTPIACAQVLLARATSSRLIAERGTTMTCGRSSGPEAVQSATSACRISCSHERTGKSLPTLSRREPRGISSEKPAVAETTYPLPAHFVFDQSAARSISLSLFGVRHPVLPLTVTATRLKMAPISPLRLPHRRFHAILTGRGPLSWSSEAGKEVAHVPAREHQPKAARPVSFHLHSIWRDGRGGFFVGPR